jgi:hypothetical protein
MKKSYVNEASLTVNVTIDLGEISELIDILKELDGESSNHWRAASLRNKLEKLRRDSAQEALRGFETMLDNY